MAKNKSNLEHPSHGLALFSVTHSSGGTLFGSPLHTHYTTVHLKISAAHVYCEEGDLDTERYLDGEQYIEVEFSATQFGELISRQNIAPGIPCTIRRRNGKGVESPPPRRTFQRKVSEDFQHKIKKLFSQLETSETNLEEVLKKKSIGLKDRQQIKNIFRSFRNQCEDALPFAIEMFTEATYDTVAAARQEIAIALRAALQMAGINSLGSKELLPPAEPKELLPPAEPKEPHE